MVFSENRMEFYAPQNSQIPKFCLINNITPRKSTILQHLEKMIGFVHELMFTPILLVSHVVKIIK